MRVALVCPYDLAEPGGVQGQALGIAGALARRGHEVVLVAPASAAPLSPLPGGVELVGLGRSIRVRANGSLAPLAPGPKAAGRTLAALGRRHLDVVHLHEPLVPAACLVALASARVPLVGTFHRAGLGTGYRAVGLALRPLSRRIALASAVSSAAAATARAVLGRGPAIPLVPNGVDVARFRADSPARDASHVLFVGRHEERKGLGVLLEAFTGLPGDARLEIVGSGPRTADLVARYGGDERVTFLGPLGPRELVARLQTATVLVAPSLGGESFGVVLLEAMAAGAAVLASALPGYREAAGEAARYVPAGDAPALRDALGDLLADKVARAALVEAAGARVEGFDFEVVAQRYETYYERAVTRR